MTPRENPFRGWRSAWSGLAAWARSKAALSFVLIAILVAGAYLRLSHVNWDEGTHIHPDERFLTMVVSALDLPESVAQFFDSTQSPMSPYNRGYGYFVYGTLPIFIVRVAGELAQNVNEVFGLWKNAVGSPIHMIGYDGIHFVGRVLSGLFDLGCVALVYLIGRRLYSRRVGLLAAAFYAFSALALQQSHFFTVDTFATFFALVTVYFAVRAAQGGGWLVYIALGAGLGAAVASRINLAPLAAIAVLAAGIHAWDQLRHAKPEAGGARASFDVASREPEALRARAGWGGTAPGEPLGALPDRPSDSAWTWMEEETDPPDASEPAQAAGAGGRAGWVGMLLQASLFRLALAALVAILVFRVGQPYAFGGSGFADFSFSEQWLDNMRQISLLMSGDADSPPGHQWTSRTPFVFPFVNMTVWGLGLPLGLAAWAGWALAAWQILRVGLRIPGRAHVAAGDPVRSHLLPVAWIGGMFLWQGLQYVQSMRYLLPIYPLLAIMAAWLLWWLVERATAHRAARSALLAAGGAPAGGPPAAGAPAGGAPAGAPPAAGTAALPDGGRAVASGAAGALAQGPAGGEGLAALPSAEDARAEESAAESLPLTGDFTVRGYELARSAALHQAEGDAGGTQTDDLTTGARVRRDRGAASWDFKDLSPGARVRRFVGRLPWRGMAIGLLAFVTIATVLWGWGFTSIYRRPLTRIEASRWMYDNIPEGSVVANEHWDDGLPFGIDGKSGFKPAGYYYGLTNRETGRRDGQIENYAEDTPEKRELLYRWLNEADVLVLSSNRLWGSIPRLPMRYPMTSLYYELLFAEKLGFELAARFTSFPTLFGIEFDDTGAEEAFSVYDHPEVRIYRKTSAYSEALARSYFDPIDLENTLQMWPKQVSAAPTGLYLTPEEAARQQAGGSWSDIFDESSLVNRSPALAVLAWLLVIELLGLVAFPIAFIVLRGLPDRGWGVSKVMGVLALGWLSWIGPSLKVVPYARGWIAVCLLLLAGLAALLVWRQRAAIGQFLRARGSLLLTEEAIFLVLFGLFLLIRIGNPDLWHPARGGEKPMDFAYLMAVIRSTTFPPYDPWHAGGFINYYYFGFVLIGTLIKLTGIVPWVAYNLAVPTLFAMTGVGAFSVAYGLAEGDPATRPGSEAAGRRGMRAGPLLAGLASLFFVAIIGNLGNVKLLVEQYSQLGSASVASTLPGLAKLVRAVSGLASVLTGKADLSFPNDWWFWNASRVIPDTINEFPFFTFVYADLHAHMIALPLALLGLAAAVALVRLARASAGGVAATVRTAKSPASRVPRQGEGAKSPAREAKSPARGEVRTTRAGGGDYEVPCEGGEVPCEGGEVPCEGGEVLRRGEVRATRELPGPDAAQGLAEAPEPTPWRIAWPELLPILLLGFVIGVLRATNTWDLPTYTLVGLIAVVVLELARRAQMAVPDGLRGRIGFVFRSAVAVAWRLALLLGVASATAYPFTRHYATAYGGLQPWDGAKTQIADYLTMWGFFLALALLQLLAESVVQVRERRLPSWLGGALPIIIGGAVLLVGVGWVMGVRVWLIALPLFVLALVLALGRDVPPARRFGLLLLALALAITMGVEVVRLKDDIGRMNTVFKFYVQAWVIFGVSTAFGLAGWAAQAAAWRPAWRRLAWAAVLILFAGAMLYPAFAAAAKVRDRFSAEASPHGLDGMAFMDRAQYFDGDRDLRLADDRAAMLWLMRNVEGSPVILEAQTPEYRWGSRFSIYTGLPTVQGWSWHQRQQRSVAPSIAVERRVSDVQEIYSTTDVARAQHLLDRYGVRYIIVGELERATSAPEGLAKFETLAEQGMLVRVYPPDGGLRPLPLTGDSAGGGLRPPDGGLRPPDGGLREAGAVTIYEVAADGALGWPATLGRIGPQPVPTPTPARPSTAAPFDPPDGGLRSPDAGLGSPDPFVSPDGGTSPPDGGLRSPAR